MNRERRKRIENILEILENVNLEIESLRDDEQEAFESMPEGIQEGEMGEKGQQAVDALEEASDYLDSVVEQLRSAAD